MQVFSPLVGVSFRGSEAREIVKALTTEDGESLSLEPEPNNEYDSQAVKVLWDNGLGELTHLGYIAKQNNPEVFEALCDGGDENFFSIVGFENSIKPTLLLSWNE